MTQLGFAKDFRSGLTRLDTLMIMGSSPVFNEKSLPKLFEKDLRRTVLMLATDAKPGLAGATSSTLTIGNPRRIVVGVLPGEASRHNCKARPDAVQRVVTSASLRGTCFIVALLDDPTHQGPVLNAIGRAFPMYDRRTDKPSPATKVQILLLDRKGSVVPVSKESADTMMTVREVACLVDMPPSEMNPARLAKATKDMLKGIRSLTLREFGSQGLERMGLGGLRAVGQSATQPPRMLVATFAPRRAHAPHIALVGKGITFDTGGLHLKPRGSMESMKSDMAGAAAAAGAFRVLAKQGVDCRLSLVVCLAENAIGPSAYKPDDIIELHSGKTVEINNTDAEGRLLLADGVSFAARVLKASIIVDAATLTGAQAIATGSHHAAVVTNDEVIESLAVEAGRKTGDLVHPLPFAPEFFQPEFKSPVADLRNSVKNRTNAPTSAAAQFVFCQIEHESVRWCHIDLAGPAFRSDRATGFGVALLVDLVQALATLPRPSGPSGETPAPRRRSR